MTHARLKTLVAILFALSGISGLIYEIAWSKYLSLFIGSAPSSQMIVLATFMAGLAAGSFRWGRAADRSLRPLRLYGFLELAIGGYCLLYPLIMAACEKIFVAAGIGFGLAGHPVPLAALKFALSAATLLVPTFCMGGTLPVLLRTLSRDLSSSGKDVATLYWINSLGAMAGAALAGFYLIRVFALDGAMAIAAAVNCGVGLIALFLPPVAPAEEPAAPPAAAPAAAARERQGGEVYPPALIRMAVVTAAVSGGVSMVYELGWSRLLASLLGSSTYSFSIMLMAFIAGITLGSAIASRIIGRGVRLLRLLAWCQIGTALFMLATLPVYERLPYYLWRLSDNLANTPGNFPLFLAGEFVFCFFLMIVPTTLSGMSLPVAARIASPDPHALGTSIGGVFAVNTAGAVAGALITGLALIPLAGVKGAIETGVACNALLGIALMARDPRLQQKYKIAAALAVAGAAGVYAAAVPAWNQSVASLGVYRTFFQRAPGTYEDFLRGAAERTTLWYREGTAANVAVTEFVNENGRKERSLIINGKADASTESDLATQVLLAQIPLTLVPDTGNVLVIGLGSGITAGSALAHPIRSLDCAEISPEVVACNGFFAEANRHALGDPRMRIFVEDAITFVKISPKRYSCIISEPSNPWIAGIGNLFTTEFFELMRDRLTPGGILAQWFHLYDVDDGVFRLVLRTLRRTFPYVIIWMPTDLDVVLTASMTPIRPPFPEMERRVAAQHDDLARLQMDGLPALLSTELTGPISDTAAGPGDVNSEKRPLLEFLAPISFFTHTNVQLVRTLDRRFDPADTLLLLSQYAAGGGLSGAQYLSIARFQAGIAGEDYRMAAASAQSCLARDPGNADALAIVASIALATGDTTMRLDALQRLARAVPDNPSILATLAVEWTAWKRKGAGDGPVTGLEEPIRLMRRSIELTGGKDERYVIGLGEVLTVAGRHAEAGKQFAEALDLRTTYEPADTGYSNAELALVAARQYLDAGDQADAAALFGKLRQIDPGNPALQEITDSLQTEEPR